MMDYETHPRVNNYMYTRLRLSTVFWCYNGRTHFRSDTYTLSVLVPWYFVTYVNSINW